MNARWRALVPDPLRLALALAAVLAAVVLGWRAATPPPAAALTAPPQAFSAARAMRDIAAFATAPRPTGSAANAAAADWLAGRMRAMGLHAEPRRYLIDEDTRARLARWSGGAVAPDELRNVLGTIPGRDRSLPAVLITAHYDSVWGSPGAADDGIGVATALETARAILARGRPLRDVRLLFTDGEEVGLAGAQAFWEDEGAARRIGVVVNLEARGAGGRAVMFETGRGNAGMIALMARAVPQPLANSLAGLAYRLMPNSTDFTVARARGLAGFNFAVVGDAAYYHSPQATVRHVDPRSVQDMGRQTLALVAALADAAALPAPAADAVYFDLPAMGLVHYAPVTGWLVLLLGTALTIAAYRRARPPLDAVGGGALVGIWAMAAAALLLTLANTVSGATAHPDYYDQLAALPRLEAQAALVMAAVLVAAAMLRLWPARIFGVVPPVAVGLVAAALGAPVVAALAPALLAGLVWTAMPRAGAGAWGGWIGLAALVLVLGVVAQIAAPEAAWLFAWPGLATAAALLAASLIGRALPVLILAALVTVAVTAALLPLAHLLMLNIGAGRPELLALFAPLVLAPSWPVIRMRPGVVAAGAVAACLALALLVALTVRLDAPALTVPVSAGTATAAAQ